MSVKSVTVQAQCLIPEILVTQEVEIKRVVVPGQAKSL
jgi:hypothetical protein